MTDQPSTDPQPQPRGVFLWEASGAAFMILAGSALHFVFDWTGGWPPVAVIAAVNESIWEHLKLAFWPGIAWALLSPKGVRLPLRARLAGKGFGLLVAAVLIVAIFRGYTAILHHNILLLDIATFAFAVLAGQLVSAWLSMRAAAHRGTLILGAALLLAQLAAFASLTYVPPEHSLFLDSRNGLAGIPPAGDAP